MNFYIKGVIFDMDGTLIDSMWMWKSIDEEFLGRYHIPIPEGLAEEIEGMSFLETARYFKRHFSLPMSEEEIMDTWNSMAFDKYCHEVGFKPGAKAFLQELKRRGIPIGIATSNSATLVKAVLSSLQVLDCFDTIVTAAEVQKGKPAPDIYYQAAKNLGVSPRDCLVFEDVPAGIRAGLAAGMRVIAVQDDFSSHLDEKKKSLAERLIADYAEVSAALKDTERGLCLCFN